MIAPFTSMKHLATTIFLVFALVPVVRGQQAADDARTSIARVAEQMPIYRGGDCPPDANYPSRKACADRNLLEAIYSELQYPTQAVQLTGPAKMAVVNFVVEEDGSVSNVEVYRDPGYGMGQEAQRIVQQLADQGGFEAARSGGEPVRVLMQLPIKFTKPEGSTAQ